MGRLLTFLVLAVLVQYLLAWSLTHYGIVVLGACGLWAWSLWQGRRHG